MHHTKRVNRRKFTSSTVLPRRLGAMFERCQVGSQPYGTAMVTIPQQRPDSLWATAWWCTVPSQWWECSIHVIHIIHVTYVTNIYQHHPIPIIYISWLLHNTHTHVWKNMMNMSYLIHWLTDCFIIRTYSYYPRIGSREKTYWKPHFQWVRPGFPVDFVLNQSIECWLHSHIAGYIPIISIISNDIPIISPCYIPIIIYHNPIISSDININAPMGL